VSGGFELPAPTVDSWRHRLSSAGSVVDLGGFTPMELAAVGAGSPLRGLVATRSFLETDDERLAEEMQSALDGLVGRGLAEPVRAGDVGAGPVARGGSDDLAGVGPVAVRLGGDLAGVGPVAVRLGGDLAGLVAVRRRPALVGVVSLVDPRRASQPFEAGPADPVLAVFHGLAVEGQGLVGLIEETLDPGDADRPVHRFVLATPAHEAERIVQAYVALGGDINKGLALASRVLVPHLSTPVQHLLVIESGRARCCADGATWSEEVGLDRWSDVFGRAVGLPPRP
jgi:hypothetical protein